MRFARDAWFFVLPAALPAAAAALLGWWLAAALLLALAAALLLFFRIPPARSDAAAEVVLSAASGRITHVEPAEDVAVAAGELTRIVTFLSVFDVHVQRAPIDGRTVASRYTPGRKVAAFRADAGRVNEQRLTILESADGTRIGIRQIAGLIARRIVGYLEPGSAVGRGQLIGLIRFGSRVDVIVPADYTVLVARGDRVRCGVTPLARPPAPKAGGGDDG